MTDLQIIEKSLEIEMIETAAAKYLADERKRVENGGGGDTLAGNAIIKDVISDLAEEFDEFIADALRGRPGAGMRAAENLTCIVKLRDVGYEESPIDIDRIALGTVTTLFDLIMKNPQGYPKTTIAKHVGEAMVDEMRWTSAWYNNEAPQLRSIAKRYETSNSSYRHVKRAMTFLHNKHSDQVSLDPTETIELGARCVELAIKSLGDWIEEEKVVKSNKTRSVYRISDDGSRWIKDFNKSVAYNKRDYSPMVVPPLDWTPKKTGGYLTIANDFVKRDASRGKNDCKRVMDAVNKIQSTPWKVDGYILDLQIKMSQAAIDFKSSGGEVIYHCASELEKPERPVALDAPGFDPENSEDDMGLLRAYKRKINEWNNENIKRLGKYISQSRGVSIAQKYRDFDDIYFPMTVDFRMRMYPLPTVVNPQAADVSRALIRFSEEKLLTEDGLWWLGVAVAGLMGNDKVSLDERSVWAMENVESMRAMVEDPTGCTDWLDADKPFQFLQAAREYVMAFDAAQAGEDFYSSLPVQVDGKCNGLQHYALMTRDESVAHAVGLIYSDQPGDIYTEVAQRALGVCERSEDDLAKAWVGFGVPRKVAKRPTMTCVYGSGRFGYSTQIKQELEKQGKHPEGFEIFETASYLAGVIDDNLGACIGLAGDAMKFIQKCVKIYSKYQADSCQNIPLEWTTPMGCAVTQDVRKQKVRRVSIRLGKKRIALRDRVDLKVKEDTRQLDSQKMASAACPNFVHSIDASHMYMTAERCEKLSFSMIHDSFGCHASDVDQLVSALKEAAIEMHSSDLLKGFRDQIAAKLPDDIAEKLPALPQYGTLDVSRVRESDFFFS